jgi:hypothetical protein
MELENRIAFIVAAQARQDSFRYRNVHMRRAA